MMKTARRFSLWQWCVICAVALVAIGGTAIAAIGSGGATAADVDTAALDATLGDFDLSGLELIDSPSSALGGMAGGGGGGASGGGGADIQVAQYN